MLSNDLEGFEIARFKGVLGFGDHAKGAHNETADGDGDDHPRAYGIVFGALSALVGRTAMVLGIEDLTAPSGNDAPRETLDEAGASPQQRRSGTSGGNVEDGIALELGDGGALGLGQERERCVCGLCCNFAEAVTSQRGELELELGVAPFPGGACIVGFVTHPSAPWMANVGIWEA